MLVGNQDGLDSMRSVYQAANLVDAQLVKDALEAEGIPAFVTGADLIGAMGELPCQGLIEIRVPDGAWPAARVIVERVDSWLAEAPAVGDWSDEGLQPA